MTKLFSYFVSEGSKSSTAALEDAYRIHGDGVATMIPEKLVQREEFQRILKEIDGLEITPEDVTNNK